MPEDELPKSMAMNDARAIGTANEISTARRSAVNCRKSFRISSQTRFNIDSISQAPSGQVQEHCLEAGLLGPQPGEPNSVRGKPLQDDRKIAIQVLEL